MRFAGTAKQYSIRAIPQPIRIAAIIGNFGNLRFPYQATVMKTFEQRRRKMVVMGVA
jgi:hypothetical protein